MSSWFATAVDAEGQDLLGSFFNVVIDGRLTIDNAKEVARKTLKGECALVKRPYNGFKLVQGNSWFDVKPDSPIFK